MSSPPRRDERRIAPGDPLSWIGHARGRMRRLPRPDGIALHRIVSIIERPHDGATSFPIARPGDFAVRQVRPLGEQSDFAAEQNTPHGEETDFARLQSLCPRLQSIVGLVRSPSNRVKLEPHGVQRYFRSRRRLPLSRRTRLLGTIFGLHACEVSSLLGELDLLAQRTALRCCDDGWFASRGDSRACEGRLEAAL